MYLTPAQLAAVAAERAALARAVDVAADDLAAARAQSGCTAENQTVDVALDHYRRLVERVAVLDGQLAAADGAPAPTADRVTPGVWVTVRFAAADPEVFFYGAPVTATVDVDVVTPGSPLGVALAGASAGETVRFAAPGGRVVAVTVDAVTVDEPASAA